MISKAIYSTWQILDNYAVSSLVILKCIVYIDLQLYLGHLADTFVQSE